MRISGKSVDQFGNRRADTSQNQSIQGDNNYTGFENTQMTVQSINQQTMSFNNRNNAQMDQDKFKMSDNYQHIFKDINGYLDDIKKSSENNDEIIKDMQGQSEKLGTAISFLRQFMFMHNIYFDNNKFLNEQQLQSEYESSTIQRNNNIKSSSKSQPKNNQQGTSFFQKQKMSQIGNASTFEANPSNNQRRDKSPINNANQQTTQNSLSANQHLNSQQSQQNAPSKLSGMLNSILQDRKTKPTNANSKSGIISTKKAY